MSQMFEQIKSLSNNKKIPQLLDVRNIGLYIFGIVVLAIAWSGAKTVQSNYQLQKKIVTLQQENAILELQSSNAALQNQFYQTNEYLELSARQNLGLAAPGEKVLIVPKKEALKYIDPSITLEQEQETSAAKDDRPKYIRNLEDWRDFLLGRKLFNS
jgi:cell division protein FtsB